MSVPNGGRENERLAFIIDLDDTLIQTRPVFKKALDDLIQLMERQGFDAQRARLLFKTVDADNLQKLGLVDDRYRISMVDTYQTLCAQGGRRRDESVLAQIDLISRPVWLGHFPLLDGVVETLAALKAQNHILILYTKGTQELQARKICEAGVASYFDAIYIVPRKTKEELARILANHTLCPQQTWVVGDGIRSEINPALALNLNAVLVEGQTWTYENEALLDESVCRIASFGQLLSLWPTAGSA